MLKTTAVLVLTLLAVAVEGVPFPCTDSLTPQSSQAELIDALRCVEESTYTPQVPKAPTVRIPDMAKSFRHHAASLHQRAASGIGGSTRKVQSLVDDYNALTRQIRAIPSFSVDSYIMALETFSSSNNPDQTASAVADLAKGLEAYLGESGAAKAFDIAFSELAKNASNGIGGSGSKARVLQDEYNVMVRHVKSVFSEQPFFGTLEELDTINDANETAASIARSAERIAIMLSSLER